MNITLSIELIYILAILVGYANQNCVWALGLRPKSPPCRDAEGSEARLGLFLQNMNVIYI